MFRHGRSAILPSQDVACLDGMLLLARLSVLCAASFLGTMSSHFKDAQESPCFTWIIPSLGPAVKDIKLGQPCGQSRYCANCERVFTMLGQGWHLPVMCDVLYPMLVKLIDSVVGDASESDFYVSAVPDPHQCGPACPCNPRPGC